MKLSFSLLVLAWRLRSLLPDGSSLKKLCIGVAPPPRQHRSLTMADWTDCLNFGISIAKQASKVVLTAFQQEKEVKLKSSPADLVTETDQRVETIILSAIRSQYPQHRFIGEESVAAGERVELTDLPTWIIDPIDGTVNFVHR
uniref:Inositol-phosphate phosphatase n=1 Tax=Astatotilapia calliptera TaxID=8154 RepID=A0AAX7VUC2_ASTCA